MRKTVLCIIKSVLSLSFFPLWFVKIFHGVGHLPSQTDPGEIVSVDFYHSMFENVTDMGCSFLAYLSFALISLSVAASLLAWRYAGNKKMQIAGHAVFGINVAVFLALFVVASAVARGY